LLQFECITAIWNEAIEQFEDSVVTEKAGIASHKSLSSYFGDSLLFLKFKGPDVNAVMSQ